jgi:hypothetical protein
MDKKILENDIDMLLEETKVDKVAKKGKDMIDKTKVKDIVAEGKSIIKLIYSMKDEDFIEGKVFPQLSRLVVRAASIYGLWLINPMVGVLGFVTDRYIKRYTEIKQRKRLRNYYEAKLEYIEGRIEKEDDEKQKYKLIKMRNAFKSNLKKLDVTQTKE